MASEKEFNIVFKGEVAKTYNLLVTKERMARALKLTDDKIALLFSGKSIVIRKKVPEADAVKMQKHLSTMGAVIYLEPVTTLAANVAGASVPSPTASYPGATKAPALALEPIAQVTAMPAADADVQPPPEKFKQPSAAAYAISFITLRAIFGVLLILLGFVLIAAFSPFPDFVVRIGFLLGAMLCGMGGRLLITPQRPQLVQRRVFNNA